MMRPLCVVMLLAVPACRQQTTAPAGPTTPKEPEPVTSVEWEGLIRLTLESMTLAPVEYLDGKVPKRTTDKYLHVRIAIHNLHPTDAWQRTGFKDAKLKVEGWNVTCINPGLSVGSVPPKESRADTLHFNPPSPKAPWLSLELPVSGFGKSGSVTFLVPRDFVQRPP